MRLITVLLLLLPLAASGQIGNVAGNSANQNTQDKGIRTVELLIGTIYDTTQANTLLARLPAGTRKTGALARVGNTLWWYYPNRWVPISEGGSGGGGGSMDYAYVDQAAANALVQAKAYTDNAVSGIQPTPADGNNYVSSLVFTANTGNLSLSRVGLASLSVSLDGRYALQGHTHTIADIATLQTKLDDLQAQISGGGTAYSGSNGVVVSGTTISLTDQPYTTAEKSKLAGIAPNATANSTDAVLLSRVNHTGTQVISTVAGLQTALDGKVARSDSNTVYTTPYTIGLNYYNKSQSDARYLQTESDPQWNAQKVNYPTLTYANANYAPSSAAYMYGTGDFGQIPVGTGTSTFAGSNTFTRIQSMVSNYGNFYVADSSKGYGFNVPNSDSTVFLKVDNSGNILRQFVDGGTGDTSNSSPIAVDPSQTVTLTGAQTLTNKTLTAPVINNPTGITTANISGLDAALAGKEPAITEPGLTGRYFTGYKTFGVLNTDSVTEGINRLYYTTARVNSAFDTRFTTKTTTDLAEGSNLYYTPARARTAISATGTGLSYNSSTGVLTSTALTTETDPVFTASGAFGITSANRTDWTTAYNKRIVSAAFTGTTTKTLTLTAGDNSTITASFTDATGGGGSGSIASTTNVLKGDGTGNAVAATPGTDYVIPSGSVASATTANTVTTIAGQVVAGTNMTRTGSGTTADPYVLNSTASGGSSSTYNGPGEWQYFRASATPNGATLQNTGGFMGTVIPQNTGLSYSPSTATYVGKYVHLTYSTGASAGAGNGVYGNNQVLLRGTAANDGGATVWFSLASTNMASDSRFFAGLFAQSAITTGSGNNPSIWTNIFGVGKDAADATLQIMYNDGSGAASKQNTGLAWSGTTIYKIKITFPPGASPDMTVEIWGYTDAAKTMLYTATIPNSGGNLPVANTKLAVTTSVGTANTTPVDLKLYYIDVQTQL